VLSLPHNTEKKLYNHDHSLPLFLLLFIDNDNRSFGLANTDALNEGKTGVDCRGEEHEVSLVRYPRSRKTRIFWNKRNITHLFRDANHKLDKISFAWQARRGDVFQVIVRSGDVPQGKAHFEFYIGGIGFAQLPLLGELGRNVFTVQGEEVAKEPEEYEVPLSSPSGEARGPQESSCQGPLFTRTLSGGAESSVSALSGGAVSGCDDSAATPLSPGSPQHGPGSLGFRLSMAGLSPSVNEVVDELDELQSDVYSLTIEVLRTRITELIPKTEEMVSRAIMNAFFSGDSSSGPDSFSDSTPSDHFFEHSLQLEANAVAAAYAWISASSDYGAADLTERFEFLQEKINGVMVAVRRENLSAPDACQLLVNVALVLGLEVNTAVENNTVLLVGLDPCATEEELFAKLKIYGEIDTAAVSHTAAYGLCRYCYPASVGLATQASENGDIRVCGRITQALSLTAIAKLSSMSLEGASRLVQLLKPTLSIDSADSFIRLGEQESFAKASEEVSTTFMMHSENSGRFTSGQEINQAMNMATKASASSRTVSTLDSDSERGPSQLDLESLLYNMHERTLEYGNTPSVLH